MTEATRGGTTRIVALADLLGVAEIAALLDVKAGTVTMWRQRGLLPPPALRLAATDLWTRPTVEEWAKATGRMP